MRKKILFLCTHNSCRSQMAEGIAKKLMDQNEYEIYSAGTMESSVDPMAIEVLKEIGIDISKNFSKNVNQFLKDDFFAVITVCDKAKENCPFFSGKTLKRIHKSFDDPSLLSNNVYDREKKLEIYRRVRDEIKNFIEELNKDFNQSN